MGGPDVRPVVILADDDEAITSNLAPFLDRAGFTVHVASDGNAALELVERLDPDGCVLDVLMPGPDGREVLRRLRRGGRWLPVVLLTQVGESAERAIALDEGADDYLNKPFDPYELLARLRAVLRRARPGRRPLSAWPTVRAGDLRLDRISRRAWLRDAELVLTPKAMLLLDYLCTHPDELMTRERLLEVLWGFETAPVDLTALLDEVAEAVAEIPAARERVIRVTVPRAPWPLPLVEGDRDLLFIAVQNLVANAVKFSAPGDTVEVRASEDDDALLLEVADTGAGIPADEIGQVWQELARGRAARSLPGTGIGLALVRVIVARHGGQVAIRSRDGQGTVVGIRLPVPDRARIAPDVAGLRQDRDTPGMAAV